MTCSTTRISQRGFAKLQTKRAKLKGTRDTGQKQVKFEWMK